MQQVKAAKELCKDTSVCLLLQLLLLLLLLWLEQLSLLLLLLLQLFYRLHLLSLTVGSRICVLCWFAAAAVRFCYSNKQMRDSKSCCSANRSCSSSSSRLPQQHRQRQQT